MGKKPTRGVAGAADEFRTAAFVVCRSVRTLEDVAGRAERGSSAIQFDPTFVDIEDACNRLRAVLAKWGR